MNQKQKDGAGYLLLLALFWGVPMGMLVIKSAG